MTARRARAMLAAGLVVAGCAALASAADSASDAPEASAVAVAEFKDAPSYREALARWHDAQDINAWIGARFRYDLARAMLLSETQRQKNGRLPILAPEAFFAAPSGVCVDLSRFAVETLQVIDPTAKATYLMIEFDPVAIGGNMLRRHWVAAFEVDGQRYFFADSKRPGHIAGPYASTQEFIADYARYRGRRIVAFSETPSYEHKARALAVMQERDARP
ncbi:MAG TPA: transglutaminase-like domain-containing protein [Burkholderiaceae bacterium]